jgi:hypothetical protein
MSNFLAVATVTAGLVQLLQSRVSQDVSGATVTNVRPESNGAGLPNIGVNLFLYQVTPNPHWRNEDLATRDTQGRLRRKPRLALDLHYLLTFYGDEVQLEPQRVLGSVARTLNDQPVLTRALIADAQNANPALAASNLADENELVRFTPMALSLEELSKLWSVFFQIPYTLSMAYQGTLVFLESDAAPRTSLPVLARTVRVRPFRQPAIQEVRGQGSPLNPILPGSTLLIRGRQLRGDQTSLLVAGIEVHPAAVSPAEIRISLSEPPFPAGELRAGVQGVQVVHRYVFGLPGDPNTPSPADPHHGVESNVAPFVLRPAITQPVQALNVQNDPNNTRRGEIRVALDPTVGQKQRVVLLLNGTAPQDAPAYTFAAPSRSADETTLDIPFARVEPGAYLVRVQVDGAESLLEQDTDPNDPVFSGPQVNIP